MEQKSQVHEVVVEHEGLQHRASYFVENDTLYAHVDGRLLLSTLGDLPAAEVVRGMLQGHLQSRSRRISQAQSWRDGVANRH